MKIRIRIVAPSGESVFEKDTTEAITIGRAEGDIVLGDERCSKRHAEIVESAEGLLLRDLGSTNGTRVKGQKVLKSLLNAGDEIRIGSVVMHVEEFRPAKSEGEVAGGKAPGLLAGWPDNYRSLPVDKLKEYLDHVDPEALKKSVRLKDLLEKRKKTGTDG